MFDEKDNRPLSQAESKMLTHYLREKYQLEIRDALFFWRKTPEVSVTAVDALWNKKINFREILLATGRLVINTVSS